MPKEKILVVDDELHIRQALQASLETEGYLVQTAENGKEGVEKCRSWRPALVILDVRMPVMDGHLASIEIKYDERLKDTRLVFLTANADEDSRSIGLGHGADSYLTKPFKVEELLKRVDDILHPLGSREEKAADAPAGAPAAPAVVDEKAKAAYLENLRKKFGAK
ncbi:MAG TPA: response regulator [bacterium]|jgi:two-component system alkaline phosphatase synthesis response regulator PhoP|nr:response regulator [bacterium]HXB97428.1 response regulator [bacterium]